MDFFSLLRCLSLLLWAQMVQAENRVALLNPPEEAVPGHRLKVLSRCDRPGSVHLQCVVSFDSGSISTFTLRTWNCNPGKPHRRSLTLALPDWLVYRPDGTIPLSQWVLGCLLRVSLSFADGDGSEAAQDVASVEVKPYFSRPFKQHQLCFDWGAHILKLQQRGERRVCPVDQETVALLSSIFASSGEHFGLTKSLQPFSDELLEHLRLKAVSFIWCAFSLWLLVTDPCRSPLCGVLHHIDRQDNYATPTLFLTSTGQLHVQVSGEAQWSSAFLCPFKVPLREWCHITVELHGKMVLVSMVCLEKDQRRVYSAQHIFEQNLVLNDTVGYFVIGGGKYVNSVEGYFGPVMFYRNRIPAHTQSQVELPDVIAKLNLTQWLQNCEDFQLQMKLKIAGYAHKEKQTESCVDVYHQYMTQRRSAEPQCEQWEAVVPNRKYAAKVAQILVAKRGGREVSLSAVGRSLYLWALQRLGRSSIQTALPVLLQAGCLHEPAALHLTAALYSAGLGLQQRPDKSWLLSLLSAQKDHRLSLLRLGFVHLYGVHGLYRDPDLAYAYYSNIGQQTGSDSLKHSAQQNFVEEVYLTDEDTLKHQTNEDHHIFQWLQLQAKRGEAEAEQAMGQMLFWGQQGVAPDLHKAVKHYQRGALQHEDPTSMYNYGIVLLQGQGVAQDIPKGVAYLKKAMEKGSVPAMNALAWYYEQFKKDYQEAVKLWERADLLGSPDAAMNLGVMYLQGLYPGTQPDQYLAYKYFLKSAQRGHIRGANQLAAIWTTGIPGQVDRRPLDAVRWSRWAAEHNGYLGRLLHRGLEYYFKNDVWNSLLFYLMAAESGFAAAQFNVAYLCEQNSGQFLDPAFASSCMWRYYNLTIQSEKPHPNALLKLGDLLYEGRSNGQWDVSSAARMYLAAARRQQPQGLYNLAVLVAEGYRLPLSILSELGLSQLYMSEPSVLLKALYQNCRDSEDTDSFVPCSLALFSVYLQELQRDYSSAIMYAGALVAAVAPTVFLLLLSRLTSRTRPERMPLQERHNDV